MRLPGGMCMLHTCMHTSIVGEHVLIHFVVRTHAQALVLQGTCGDRGGGDCPYVCKTTNDMCVQLRWSLVLSTSAVWTV